MKEIVISSPFKYEIREAQTPAPGRGEVLIQMKAAGVCGSDVHIFKGENPCSSYPLVPGHENTGIVAAVGEGVNSVRVGDHIVVDLVIACGKCYQCQHGRENVCENVLVRGSGTDGGWREYFIAPEDDVYVIDKKIPWEEAVLIEPYAIGAHCCNRARVTNEDIVLVLGAGTIGSIIIQTCKMIGAKVICADINDAVLERARKYGADMAVNTKKEDLISKVQTFTGGHCCTVAFDSACFHGSLSSLLEEGLVGNAGRIVNLGFCTEPEPISQAMIAKRELDIIGSRMSAYQFVPVAANMAAGKYNTAGLITHRVQFSQIRSIFDMMENPEPGAGKMIILFD